MRVVKNKNINRFYFVILLGILLHFNAYSQNSIKNNPSLPTLYEIKSLDQHKDNIFKAESWHLKMLGIMCKVELDLEKKAKVPIKLRLGTQEVVDKLENKGRN